MKTKAPVSTLRGLCENIKRGMADVRGFEIGLRVILGNFAFQKMAMVKDLQERANELPMHDVIAAIAGDSKAKSAMTAEQIDPDPKEFDLIPPDNEFLVLEADGGPWITRLRKQKVRKRFLRSAPWIRSIRIS